MTYYEDAHLWIEFVDADPYRAHVDYFAADGWKREDLGPVFRLDGRQPTWQSAAWAKRGLSLLVLALGARTTCGLSASFRDERLTFGVTLAVAITPHDSSFANVPEKIA